MLLSISCGFDDMVKKTISGDTREECLEGIIQTLKDLIAQVDVKIKDAGVRARYDRVNGKQKLQSREMSELKE